eukprot:4194827-Lingulodinium_polyedra.AAC.1
MLCWRGSPRGLAAWWNQAATCHCAGRPPLHNPGTRHLRVTWGDARHAHAGDRDATGHAEHPADGAPSL